MADYSRQLFEMFAAPGEAIQGNRDRVEAKRRYDESAARQLFNDQQAQQNNDRDFNFRGERAKVGDNQWSQEFGANNAYRNRSLSLQELQASQKAPQIQTFYTEDGRETRGVYDPSAPGGFVPVGGAKAAPPPRAQQMTTVDKKAILDADAAAEAGTNVVGALDRAIELSGKAYTGPTAGVRGYVTSLWGNDAGTATEELNNLVTAQALDQLKTTFGGMPSDGERKILLQIQGSANQSPAVREEIFKRAKVAAQKRIAFNQATAKAIRSGDYFSEGGGSAPVGQLAPGVEDGGYVFRGGDPSDPNNWEPAQ